MLQDFDYIMPPLNDSGRFEPYFLGEHVPVSFYLLARIAVLTGATKSPTTSLTT